MNTRTALATEFRDSYTYSNTDFEISYYIQHCSTNDKLLVVVASRTVSYEPAS